jgi:hypothetical protein
MVASAEDIGAHAVSTVESREFYDDQNRRWVVRELDAPVDNPGAGKSLYFAGEGVMRRVWTYPSNWSELPDAELYEVSCRYTPR